MKILVSDTSALVDLERGSLLEATFRLPFEFVVPDLLYERELRDHGGEGLLERGMRIAELDGDGVTQALGYRRRRPALSLPDCFALVLAVRSRWILLTGDAELRRLANAERVECHGVLWLMDEMLHVAVASARQLHDGLDIISTHPRCRLPRGEVRARLTRYAALMADMGK